MDGLADVLDIVAGETSDRDASVLGHVDAELTGQTVALLLLEPGEAEHSNLVGDVTPAAGAALLLQGAAQLGSHRDDTLGHLLDILQPLHTQLWVGHDQRRNSGAVHRWVRVHRADDNLQLRQNLGRLLLAATDHGESTNSLAVQAHVLGERLRQHNLVSILDEHANGRGIAIDVTGSETLVGHVEIGKQIARLHQLRQLFPLIQLTKEKENVNNVQTMCSLQYLRIDASGVVGTGVQQDNRLLGHLGHVLQHALEIEAASDWIVVAILLDAKASSLEEWHVIAPSWRGHVNVLRTLMELAQKVSADCQRTSARDALHGGVLQEKRISENIQLPQKTKLTSFC